MRLASLGRAVERRYALDTLGDALRRSLDMLASGVDVLSRDQALQLLGELTEVQQRLDRLQAVLRQQLAEDDSR